MTKKLTIIDIARIAGVGKSTVSRVLTNDPNVKKATREKVERVIQQSGFVPSKSAQGMRGGAKVVGIILSRLDSSSENRAVSGILQVLYAAGYDAVIMESLFSTDKTNEHLLTLHKRNVDGVILFGFTGCDLTLLKSQKLNAVLIAAKDPVISSVSFDDHGIIEQAITHITKQGKKHVSFVGVDPSDETTGFLRLNAYLAQCKRHAITPLYKTGQLSYESAYELTDSVLLPETEAIVCASDTLAMGVAKRLQECNRRDITVSGVGATELLSFLFPNTFSVDPGYFQAGETAATLLLNQLSDDNAVFHQLTLTASIHQ